MVSRRMVLGAAGAVAGAGAAGAVGYRAWRDREPAAPPAQDAEGHLLWRNWSGIEHAYPVERLAPRSEEELASLLRTAAAPIRPVGAGHSFTGLATTDGALLSLDGMKGLVSHNKPDHRATIWAGSRLMEIGPALAEIGQEMPNLPDINKQSLAGGIATGTHGTGRTFKALHGQITKFRIALADGAIRDCDANHHPELFAAARVGLGAFGVLTQVELQNAPLMRVRKRTWVADLEETMAQWPELQSAHRNIEFYAVPFTGYAVIIACDPTDQPVSPRGPDEDVDSLMQLKALRDWLGFAPGVRRETARMAFKDVPPTEAVDEGWKLLSNERPVRFNEMEYHLPLDAQIPALREIVAAIEQHRSDVFFPIEARTIHADDAWLSPFYGRDCGSVAVHAYYKDDYQFLFDLIEPIFRRYEGRPHWGKLHSLGAGDFAALYPRWNEAVELRREVDPEGRLLNTHLRRVFLGESA
ncbi:MAG: D-arabinono-1,4-lactone oxidase [Hyphomonadaceae bacterium]|nr:D-arabinono-1,4-lactone oxidase [Hyphomonadaceae bacterium]